MSLWRAVQKVYVDRCVERGDWRQATAYLLQCKAKRLPEDVDEEDYQYARRMGIGSHRWWKRYYRRRGL